VAPTASAPRGEGLWMVMQVASSGSLLITEAFKHDSEAEPPPRAH